MNIINIIFSLLHFLLYYLVLITALLSNNMKILVILLFLMIYIKLLFHAHNRCIVTILEKNDIYSEVPNLFIKTLTNYEMPIREKEIISINLAVLILINKIIALQTIRYFYPKI